MNSKDIFIAIGFACVITLSLQYFFPSKQVEQEETTFIAPKEKKEYKPLNLEVDFLDSDKKHTKPHTTEINTSWGTATFSTDGASLETLDYNHTVDGSAKTIRTLFPLPDTERENRCFLVAFSHKTPFFYKLVSCEQNETASTITYETEYDEAKIRKTFVVDAKRPKIDVIVDIVPKKDTVSLVPRIIFPSPVMPQIKETDVISSIVIDQQDMFVKKRVDQLDVHRGWFSPTLFGSDSRYFVYALTSDQDHFTARAYYKLQDHDRLFSILEGYPVTKPSSWKISFYCGPKELSAINDVDTRLEKTLEYSGWFAPIAKIILYLLRWFYKYFHNYGLAIIALTILFHIMLLPFTLRGEQRMKQQMEMQKKITYLKQRYKDQPERFAAEHSELIRTHSLSLFSGCLLPLLLQIPLFFALSRVLSNSFELYQAPLLWIPDLSAKDPYYILPFLIFVAMLWQVKNTDAQQRPTLLMGALFFGAAMANIAAGLALYFCIGRILSSAQSYILKYYKLA